MAITTKRDIHKKYTVQGFSGTVEGQPKSGSRNLVWVRFDTPVVKSGSNLYLTPVAGLNKLKRR